MVFFGKEHDEMKMSNGTFAGFCFGLLVALVVGYFVFTHKGPETTLPPESAAVAYQAPAKPASNVSVLQTAKPASEGVSVLQAPAEMVLEAKFNLDPTEWPNIRLRNIGDRDTGKITAYLTNSDDFAIHNNCGWLSKGGDCTIGVFLKTTDSGTSFGTLELSAETGNTISIVLKGSATGTISTWCWGDNTYNQIGQNTKENKNPQPVRVAGLPSEKIIQFGLGMHHSCVLLASGHIWCWGVNSSGMLGSGDIVSYKFPVEVMDVGKTFVDISVFSNHSCAIASDRSLWCWGGNTHGALGNGGAYPSNMPGAVLGMDKNVTFVSVGYEHTCAVKDGGAWCWGSNVHGELGNNSLTDSYEPVQVLGLESGVVDVAAGYMSSCALKLDGTIWCWGNNRGWLGIPANYGAVEVAKPLVQQPGDIVKLYRGESWFCGRKVDNTLWCWGDNKYGQLGTGPSKVHNNPVLAQSGTTAVDWQMGDQHTCGLREDHTIWCSGYNAAGTLGDGSLTDRSSPVQVQNLPGTPQLIGAGGLNTCAVIR